MKKILRSRYSLTGSGFQKNETFPVVLKEPMAESVELDEVIIDCLKDWRIFSIKILDAGKRTNKGPLDLIDLTIVKGRMASIKIYSTLQIWQPQFSLYVKCII